MNQEKLFHTNSPSIHPLFCAVPYGQHLSQLNDLNDKEGFGTDSIESPTIDRFSWERKTIAAESISEFLLMSRKYLGLDRCA